MNSLVLPPGCPTPSSRQMDQVPEKQIQLAGWMLGAGRLFEVGRLITFSAFRMGADSRRALIRGWALIRINTVCK